MVWFYKIGMIFLLFFWGSNAVARDCFEIKSQSDGGIISIDYPFSDEEKSANWPRDKYKARVTNFEFENSGEISFVYFKLKDKTEEGVNVPIGEDCTYHDYMALTSILSDVKSKKLYVDVYITAEGSALLPVLRRIVFIEPFFQRERQNW